MPEIDFDPKFKKTSSEALEFDRLKLKKDEKARIALLERPTFAYVHTLRAPKIANGRAVKVEKKTRKGDTYVDYDMDFVGRPLCLGDLGILADKGVDPDNCPACKRSTATDEITPPDRRFAMNVIRYAMRANGQLVQPFACSCVVWSFTEGIYNRLVDIAQEHGALVGRDLLLGPCTDEGYQKYEIQAGSQALWQQSEQLTKLVRDTFEQNRVAELERACGRKAEARWMLKDVDSIAERWRTARGEKDGTESVGASVGAGAGSLTDGLADLLGGEPKSDPVDVGGLLGGTESGSSTGPKSEPAKVTSTGDTFDFDSILGGLK
jgi:hypothetical protein